jgi:integrase
MTEFYLKKTRNSDSILSLNILRRIGRGTDEQKTKTLELENIEAVNGLLRRREITEVQAIELARSEVSRLRLEQKPPKLTATINFEIAQRYYNKALKKKPNRKPRAAYNRVMRAAKALGAVPLPTASEEELVEAVMRNVSNNSSQRGAIETIGSLLSFIGRTDLYLHKPKQKRPNVKHLTLAQFKKVLVFIPVELHNFYWTAIGTGGRTAECFGMEIYSESRKAVFIETTLDRDLEEDATKTGEVRWAPVISEAVEYVKAWIETPQEFKKSIRGYRFAEILAEACIKAGVKPIQCKDLRHSYAIYLLSKRIPLEMVARALGNSIVVCQYYYVGFVLFAQEFDMFKDI